MNYSLLIKYDGERYRGWQRLSDNIPTVQGKIESVLSAYLEIKTEISGAGRTDSGVHALGQVATFVSKAVLDCENLKIYLNRYLPDDIMILSVAPAADTFHARLSAKSKTYMYRILTDKNPFERRYAMSVFEKLNIDDMREAARYFEGTHDFTAFTNGKSKKKSKVRTVYRIGVEEKGSIIELTFEGNGFLYNMVRRMAGVLIEVGQGKISPSQIPDIIDSADRSKINLIADAKGLFLVKVGY